jgi:hypothetical protein
LSGIESRTLKIALRLRIRLTIDLVGDVRLRMSLQYVDQGENVLVDGEVGKCVLLSNRELVLETHYRLVDDHFLLALQLLEDHLVILEGRGPTVVVLSKAIRMG